MIRKTPLGIVSIAAFCFAPFFFARAQVSFQTASTYAVGTNPRAVALGDFNRDGKTDLVVVNSGDANDSGSVSILFGNGDGSFQTAQNIAIGKNCTGLVAGDFNGDGNDDIALVRPGDPTVTDNGDVSIFLGNGDGTFRQGGVLTPGKNPASNKAAILAVDLNGDQRLDLVVANAGDKTFSVLLGNGDGSFEPPVAYPVSSAAYFVPSAFFTVDLSGSGEKDLVMTWGPFWGVWLSNGDGTFRQGASVAGSAVSGGDFNGDKKDDLIVTPFHICIFHCGEVLPDLLVGNGDGSFQSPISIGQPASLAADFDGDGKLDLIGVGAASRNGPAQFLVLLGNGDGTFQAPILSAGAASAEPFIVLATDINGDHAPDIVTIDYDNNGSNMNSISVLVNSGTDFAISASSPSPGSLSTGESATSTVSLSLLNSFDGPVSLSCSVQPSQAGAPSCSLSSNLVMFDDSGKAAATLTIADVTSAESHNSFQSINLAGFSWLPLAGVTFVVAGFSLCSSRKRPAWMLSMAAVLFSGLLMLGCGGNVAGGPKVTTYTIVVTGNTGIMQHSTTVPVRVR